MATSPTCECGTCEKCKHRAYMYEYRRRPGKLARQRESAVRYREENAEALRQRDRMRCASRNTYVRTRNPDKFHARKTINDLVYNGKLERGACEVCGKENAEAHHPDYTKPTEVRWFCRQHHQEHHRHIEKMMEYAL